ncbi:C-GCAxxG-C-C family protein [Chloroflexota bacterium]
MRKYFDFLSNDIVRAGIALRGGGDRATLGSCGIFSGGLMALTAKLGPRSQNPSKKEMEVFDKDYSKINEFRDWFIKEFGGVTCKDVQLHLFGRFFNLMNDEERQEFIKCQQLLGIQCNQATTKAALKVAEILCLEENTADGESRQLR